jgi:hypothetical protein
MTLKRGTYTAFTHVVLIAMRKVGRRGHQVLKRKIVKSRGTMSSADLGGSSNYSSVILED